MPPSGYQRRQDPPWPQPATAGLAISSQTSIAAVVSNGAQKRTVACDGRPPGREAAAPVRTERLSWSCLEHQHGRRWQPSMTQACLPVWPEATDQGCSHAATPQVCWFQTRATGQASCTRQSTGNIQADGADLAMRVVHVWKLRRSFRHRPDASLQNDRRPTARETRAGPTGMPSSGPCFAVSL